MLGNFKQKRKDYNHISRVLSYRRVFLSVSWLSSQDLWRWREKLSLDRGFCWWWKPWTLITYTPPQDGALIGDTNLGP